MIASEASNSSADVVLSARGLSKRFGALVVVDDVSLDLRRREALGIVGPNGAGKTTMLSLFSGAQAASAGAVMLGGADVSRLSAAERARRGLVRTHQIPQPFLGMTVFENVFVAACNGGGRKEKDANRLALEAVERAGMSKLANRKAASLGLIDRKRLELARALGVAPSVLLLDEIAGGLTDSEASELVETIKALKASGVTIVWIEHIVHALLAVADRLICMDAGRIIADGEPRSVMSDPNVVSAYLGGSAH